MDVSTQTCYVRYRNHAPVITPLGDISTAGAVLYVKESRRQTAPIISLQLDDIDGVYPLKTAQGMADVAPSTITARMLAHTPCWCCTIVSLHIPSLYPHWRRLLAGDTVLRARLRVLLLQRQRAQ